jgi:thiamine-phosphate pyrophosphorylase
MASVAKLAERSQRLNRLARQRDPRVRRLPPVILMTDERRLPDPLPAAAGLPRGSAVILRHYDMPGRALLARRLAALCRRRGLVLLIGNDWRLALAVGAGGVHLAEGLVRQAVGIRGLMRHGAMVTGAAHSRCALVAARRAGLDAVLLSPVFPTASHPGGPVLGATRFAALAHGADLPVYGLGGIDARNAGRLTGTGVVGVAAISGLAAA